MTETYLLALLICAVLTLLAYRLRSFPVMAISSFGIIIDGMQMYSAGQVDTLVLALLLMVALCQPFLIKSVNTRF